MIIVLGVGNTLMQDDGIGVHAVRQLQRDYVLPAPVRVIDGGVAGWRLLEQIDGAEHLLVVDAVQGDQPSGSLYRLAPEELSIRRAASASAHTVDLADVLALAAQLGRLPRTTILGIQPEETGTAGMGLTPALEAALPRLLQRVVEELRMLGCEMVRHTPASVESSFHA